MIKEYTDNISKFVIEHRDLRIQNLSSKINVEVLLEMHHTIDGRKAVGIDGKTKEEYAKNLAGNVEDLVARLKRDSYNPKPSRRVRIPKPGKPGKTRPLGISCYEDKLVESAVAKLLSAVYEPKFMEFSYGFRPNRSCHNAISKLENIIMTKKVSYIVEADIKSFFDMLDHEWLIKFLEYDIADKKLMRLIRKFLKAGIMENGELIDKTEGSPQGNIMSPVLANVYLHHVLDLWFEKGVKKLCAGEAYMIRYADDNVWAFQNENDAKQFLELLKERLSKFGLEIAEDKTRMLEFGRYASERRAKRGLGRPETFNFLGFTFCCGKAKFSDKFSLRLRTDSKRIPEKLRKLKTWLLDNLSLSVDEIMERVNKSLIGHFNYYGVPTNVKQLRIFKKSVIRIIFKALNRRSQKKSYTWRMFNDKILGQFSLARPKIYTYLSEQDYKDTTGSRIP
jgi:group II intron reverse transcriptase/maturase